MILLFYIIFQGTSSANSINSTNNLCFDRNFPTTFYSQHSFPTISGLSCKSYSKCSSFDGDPNGPWCFVESGYQPWDYCKVPFCPEKNIFPTVSCLTSQDSLGTRYTGTLNRTKSHVKCQNWNDDKPHVPIIKPLDSTFKNHNFCRNPDGDLGGPWCYTENKHLRWEHCNVPTCEMEFRSKGLNADLIGKVDFFRNDEISMNCQWPWIVSVRVKISSSTIVHKCSGVLIARNIGMREKNF